MKKTENKKEENKKRTLEYELASTSFYINFYTINYVFICFNKWSIKLKFNTCIFDFSISYINRCVFDIIGVAVTVANEEEFHAKATKKVKGSKDSIKLIKNAPKVANICADVIGDICGVLSGSISALISLKIANEIKLPFDIQFILSALVSAITVSFKAFGKDLANKKSTAIVHKVGIVLNKFRKK